MRAYACRWVLAFGVLSGWATPTYAGEGAAPVAGDPAAPAAGDPDVQAGEAAPMADDAAAAASEEPATEASSDAWEGNPRGQYNHALGRLAEGAFAEAAAGFLGARDAAGPDPELRYRAAFNLGLALAGEADAAAIAAPDAVEDRIETLRDSAAWFHDAVRLAAEGDDDARRQPGGRAAPHRPARGPAERRATGSKHGWIASSNDQARGARQAAPPPRRSGGGGGHG